MRIQQTRCELAPPRLELKHRKNIIELTESYVIEQRPRLLEEEEPETVNQFLFLLLFFCFLPSDL